MGDSINIATAVHSLSRPLNAGAGGDIRVTEVTRMHLEPAGYILEKAQEVELRNRGRMETFTVLATPYKGPSLQKL